MNPVSLAAPTVPVSEELPGPEDYDPGIGLFLLVVFLLVAVAVLALSFRKQLRRTDRNFGGDGSGRGGVVGDPDRATGDEDRGDGGAGRNP